MDAAALEHKAEIDPSAGVESLLKATPARWVVYLFSDEADRPVQLLCVRNLRASLKRRLLDESPDLPSKRIDYQKLVRRVRWTRVDSAFEADLVYLELARLLFPASYQKLAAARPAWFVHVDPAAQFPRYTRTTDVSVASGELFGPLEDKSAAGRLIEQIEDWFDLCRYHNILVQSPDGKACAYKEMGRCPAPCDGGISLEQYRRLVDWSAQTLGDPGDFIRTHELRMKQAAGAMKFEVAAKIKAYVESVSALRSGAYRHVRRLRDFRWLSVQRGPTARSAKLFLVTPAGVEPIACLLGAPESASDVLSHALRRADELAGQRMSTVSAEQIGLVTHHLFSSKPAGVFVPLDQLDDRTLAAACREVHKQKVSDAGDEEGIVREVQTL